ncbi:hypothetical protein FIV42_01410 [Persicimonas caeni]|uniref:RHS repeat protein n=1 Tax=Persicimonas caeni TaxID=2292766 RepID=A0A4Y6PMG1_PERCE|nr:hypothetical protein [Persicimonas caeni]QDG49440.1 hypothetical protein FIV42_01410 [Persicimonas caeni]QED30661.1 hypothetical protein FRD00_01405 [Persicimonas caeni]
MLKVCPLRFASVSLLAFIAAGCSTPKHTEQSARQTPPVRVIPFETGFFHTKLPRFELSDGADPTRYRPCRVTMHGGRVFEFSYDERNRLRRIERIDENVPKSARLRFDFIYGASGHLTKQSVDVGLDGTEEDYVLIDDERAANGELKRRRFDTDDDGSPDASAEYEYDDAGRLTLFAFDSDLDGHVDTVHRHQYAAHGSLTRSEIDKDADGDADEVVTYRYDAQGRLESQLNVDLRALEEEQQRAEDAADSSDRAGETRIVAVTKPARIEYQYVYDCPNK